MNKSNKIMLVLLVIFTLIVVGVCTYSVLNKEEKETDAVKFLNEYIELNGKVNENNGKNYINVTISDTNTIKYITEEKAIELLEEGTGTIYFGYSSCPWCRSLVSPLAKVAKEKNETIYYLDVLDFRSSFELTNGKINKLKEGTPGYYKILELLDEQLEEFYLTDEAGNKFDTGEKRLYAPTLVAFNKGKITDIHVGTVDSQESGYDVMNTTQITELENRIEKLLDSNDLEVCTDEKC